MNWILKVSTFILLAANLVYPLTQGEPDGSTARKEGHRMVKNQGSLAIVAEAPAPEEPHGMLTCLKIEGVGKERKSEALAMLGQLENAQIFDDGKMWDVRFGPWPKAELQPLQDLLGKWGGAKAEQCSNKEKEEWEKLK